MGNIAIIPARSGSKGLKDKNIKEVLGKPLIAYTLEAAVNSGIFDEVMVSTDSEHYAEVAKQTQGVNVPFLRSAGTAGDTASTWDVIREVLENYRNLGKEFDNFCVLQPTSPMRSSRHIEEAYDLFTKLDANSVVSVCKLGHSMNVCNQLPEDHSLVGFLRNPNKYARQMNPTYYRLNGSIYMCSTKAFLEYGDIYRERSYAYIMSEEDSVDIDTADDMMMAEFLLEKRLGIVRPSHETYQRIHRAYQYINSGKLDSLECGYHELEEGIFVNVMEYQTKQAGIFEAHRKFADLHYVVSGEEDMEIANVTRLCITQPYNEQQDVTLGNAEGYRVHLQEKQTCLIMPGEAHMPGLVLNEEKHVKKAIIKITM